MKKIVLLAVFALTTFSMNANATIETTDCYQYAVDAVESEMEQYGENYNYYEYSNAISTYEDACNFADFLGEEMLMPVFLE